MRDARSVFSQAMPIMRMSCKNNNNNFLQLFDTALIEESTSVSRRHPASPFQFGSIAAGRFRPFILPIVGSISNRSCLNGTFACSAESRSTRTLSKIKM